MRVPRALVCYQRSRWCRRDEVVLSSWALIERRPAAQPPRIAYRQAKRQAEPPDPLWAVVGATYRRCHMPSVPHASATIVRPTIVDGALPLSVP